MKDLHILVREIKDGYEALGIAYNKHDIYNVLIKYYGLNMQQIEDLRL